MKSDEKILQAIESSEEWIQKAETNGAKETFDMGNDIGFTPLYCIKRNLEHYHNMLGKDKRTLQGREKELYKSM